MLEDERLYAGKFRNFGVTIIMIENKLFQIAFLTSIHFNFSSPINFSHITYINFINFDHRLRKVVKQSDREGHDIVDHN